MKLLLALKHLLLPIDYSAQIHFISDLLTTYCMYVYGPEQVYAFEYNYSTKYRRYRRARLATDSVMYTHTYI